ncbi:histidine phosphatase family protein [Paenibacillus sp. BC26]|uniref:histidine phosphatase family protein n=1 Tax=Paenibacillus sp. BC26 TaxID=1881032 RepID=UPI0008E036BC|nr:histidine phosphatase family protein [Paenibacillus sp. BC26]SFT20056.1 2,3-bisphosphoglycerate-dependent phosphoglycerate mutase [Paenibacillus sp. BC26]
MNTTLYMVRHAESSYSPKEDRTRGLSARGQEDVLRVTALLRDIPVDAVVSSPYARAMLTVQGIAEQRELPIIPFEELRERQLHGIDYPLAEGEFQAAIKRSFTDHDAVLPGGESFRQAQQRSVPVIKELLRDYRGRSIVVGTHGNVMSMIMHAFDARYGWEFWKSTSMPDVYRLEFQQEELIGVERLWS